MKNLSSKQFFNYQLTHENEIYKKKNTILMDRMILYEVVHNL